MRTYVCVSFYVSFYFFLICMTDTAIAVDGWWLARAEVSTMCTTQFIADTWVDWRHRGSGWRHKLSVNLCSTWRGRRMKNNQKFTCALALYTPVYLWSLTFIISLRQLINFPQHGIYHCDKCLKKFVSLIFSTFPQRIWDAWDVDLL